MGNKVEKSQIIPDFAAFVAEQNPWWKTGKVELPLEEGGPIQREIFENLRLEMDNRQITAIIGPRRGGKTFLIYQLIERLLAEGTPKERIIYLKAEGYAEKKNMLARIMELASNFLGEPAREFKSRVYLFIDEVEKIDNWAEGIKYWQDLNLQNLKFIVSGSSAIRILKGAGESLTDRIKHSILLTLSFGEFLSAKYGLEAKKPGLGFESLQQSYSSLLPEIGKTEVALSDYLLRGGYPALIRKELKVLFQTLLDYKDLAIHRDIFELEEIRDTKNIGELTFVLAGMITSRVNYSSVGSAVGIKSFTAKKYIGLLEDIFLLRELMVYSRKPHFSARKERKIIFLDQGMANALSGNYELRDALKPILVENAVLAHALRLRFFGEMNPTHYYWVDEKSREIDCVLVLEGKPVPVEVKYQNQITENDTETLLNFCTKFGADKAIIVTKSAFERRTAGNVELLLVPAWLFLLAR